MTNSDITQKEQNNLPGQAKILLPLFIVACAIFLRLFHITTIPLNMHIDEAGLGLNAWSLAETGTDRYGYFLPVCPLNFYGEQSAFYTYFCTLLVKLFGLSPLTLRLPAAIMGTVTVIFCSLISKEKYGEKGFYLSLVLLSIFPYFIMSSRYALDCNAMLGFLSVAVYALIKTLKKCEISPDSLHLKRFFITGLLFGAVLYTYIIAAIVIGLFGTIFALIYIFSEKEKRRDRTLQLLVLALPIAVLSVPLVLVVAVNYFDLNPIVTPFFSVPKMLTNRTEEVAVPSFAAFITKIKTLRYPLTSDGRYGSSDRFWTMYHISVLFVFAGIFFSIKETLKDLKEKRISIDLIMLLISVAEVILFILCGIYTYHINGIFVALAYFCVKGILELIDLFKVRKASYVACAAVFLVYSAYFIFFCMDYYGADTTVAYMVYGGVDEAVKMLPEEKKESEIYVIDEVGEIYFLSNPMTAEQSAPYFNDMGHIVDYKNIHFRKPDEYKRGDVIICNNAVPGYEIYMSEGIFADDLQPGSSEDYTLLCTDHYYVFFEE